jgi:hypothetical protein
MKPRFHAFWAINAALKQERLRGQLDQVRGVTNFADAPAKMHIAAWHFRKFQLPKTISILA